MKEEIIYFENISLECAYEDSCIEFTSIMDSAVEVAYFRSTQGFNWN